MLFSSAENLSMGQVLNTNPLLWTCQQHLTPCPWGSSPRRQSWLHSWGKKVGWCGYKSGLIHCRESEPCTTPRRHTGREDESSFIQQEQETDVAVSSQAAKSHFKPAVCVSSTCKSKSVTIAAEQMWPTVIVKHFRCIRLKGHQTGVCADVRVKQTNLLVVNFLTL